MKISTYRNYSNITDNRFFSPSWATKQQTIVHQLFAVLFCFLPKQ